MPCPVQHNADGIPLVHAIPDDVQADRERLHQEGPLTRVELPGGVMAWATTHHEVSKQTLNDPRLVKSVDHWADYQNGVVTKEWPLMATIPTDGVNMLALDGDAHRRLRTLTAAPFSARRVERLRPRIERLTALYLDALEERAHEPQDLKSLFTFKVPIGVIAELYGIEEKEGVDLGEMYAKLFSGTTEPGEHIEIYGALFQFFTEVVARKRATLDECDDFTADLIRTGSEGEDGLDDMEIVVTLLTVVAAGHETTVNLLTNAAKYTAPGGRIELACYCTAEQVTFRVSDNGIGMEPELVPVVFDLFTQAARAPDRAQGGLGIGLALVRRIVQAHGGTVTAQSAGAGQGSTFTVVLPRSATAPCAPEPPQEHPRPTRGRTVLVVDDNADAADMLALALRLLGHEAVVAHDGPQALSLVGTRSDWDAFILDIGMPGITGLELAGQLRDRIGERPVRFIALTGYGQAQDQASSRAAGFDHHMVKPADIDELQRQLELAG